MKYLIILVALTMMSCVSVRQANLNKFKEITEDIPIDSQTDIILVQHLYNNMVNGKK